MDYRPVGIFDSGMGGLTSVRVLRELLPGEDIAYLGDTARVPYGGRSVAELIEIAESDARFLRARAIKAMLVACGTVSSNCLDEVEQTAGVPVIGVGTDEFPAFYCRRSGHKLDYAAKDEAEIAAILKAKWALGMDGGVLIANPIAEADGLDFDYMEGIINVALEAADAAGVHGKDITPFLLAKVKDLTGGDSLESNIQLVYNNAVLGAKTACALAALKG